MLYPLDVADDLSIEVIDKRTLNKVQKNEDPVDCLLKAVQAYIKTGRKCNPKVFQQILDIFKRYTPLKFVVKESRRSMVTYLFCCINNLLQYS